MLTPFAEVVGHPVAHSLSPALHRAWYRELGLEYEYGYTDVPPGKLGQYLSARPATQIGVSVTMPHKLAAAELGDPVGAAKSLGIANTLVRHAGAWKAHNTDVSGFRDALVSQGIEGVSSAAVLGAGATARSAVLALRELGCQTVQIWARRAEQAAEAGRLAHCLGMNAKCASVPVQAQLVISTLPGAAVGQHAATDFVREADVLFDSSYHPWPSALAEIADTALSGLDLLVWQGIEQVKLMTGETPSAEVGYEAGRAELARRSVRK